MPNQYLLIILLVICVFILFGILLIIRLFSRQKLPSNNTQHSIPVKKSVQSVSTIPIRGVFTRLNFFESLDPKLFEKASKQCVEEWIKTEPLSNAGDGVSMTINTIPRLVGSSVEMTVSASSKGQMLFKEGRALIPIHNASGNELPVLKDTVSGKIIENMKGHRGVNTLTKLGAISAVIIGAAHIIAGADISKKLKIINAKIDQILAYRHIDQMAILERIYTSAQEICISSWNEQSKCKELWSLRGELRELRIKWRGEFSHYLQLIDDPAKEHWFKRMFTTQKKSDSKISAQISEGQIQLGLIEYSMRLDHLLAVVSNTIPQFENTLSGELQEFKNVSNLLKSKTDFISDMYPELSVDHMRKGMKAIVTQYNGLLTEKHPPPLVTPLVESSTNEKVKIQSDP